MSSRFLKILALLLLSSLAWSQVPIQTYPIGRIFLKNGMTLEGKNVQMSMESVIIDVAGVPQQFAMQDVVQVMVKQGKDKKFGANCAGACVGFSLGSVLASGGKSVDADGNETSINPGEYLASLALWAGVSYGVGYLAGKLADDWQVVYLSRN